MPLAGLFTALVGFFTTYVSKKIAFGLAAVSVFAGLTTALYFTLEAVIAGMFVVLPDIPGLQIGLWVALPDNTAALVAAAIGCDVSVALYRWNVENLRLMAYIT